MPIPARSSFAALTSGLCTGTMGTARPRFCIDEQHTISATAFVLYRWNSSSEVRHYAKCRHKQPQEE